jgi:hypothetical protein
MITEPKTTELALKRRHECYQLLTPKYPSMHYSFKTIRFRESFQVISYYYYYYYYYYGYCYGLTCPIKNYLVKPTLQTRVRPSLGLYLHSTTQIQTHIFSLSGIGIHDPSVPVI